MINTKVSYAVLALIALAYVSLGAMYVVNTPPWQAPDEPAHYNYIAQVAAEGCCPVIEPSDWDMAELEALKADQFPDDADLSAVTYEDWQPPLYYLITAPFFEYSQGSLTAMRSASLIFGLGTVLAAYWVLARLFPRHRVLALAAAAFVAFIPQHVAVLASVNNDSLAGLLFNILMVIALGYVGNPTGIDHDGKIVPFDESMRPHAAAIGGFFGLILLTKLTPVLPALVVILLAVAWRWRIEGRSVMWLIPELLWGIGFGLLIGLPWWVRNSLIYGFPDMLGMDAHNAAVVGQLRTTDYIAEVGQPAYWTAYLSTTFRSFFGVFGWMAVPMQPRDYWLIVAFLLWTGIGLILLIRFHDLWKLVPQQRAGVWILLLAGFAAFPSYIYYNLTFVQFQGRYLYTALIPIALLIAAGGWGWVLLLGSWLKSERAKRVLVWLPFAALLWLPVLAWWALTRYIIPYLD